MRREASYRANEAVAAGHARPTPHVPAHDRLLKRFPSGSVGLSTFKSAYSGACHRHAALFRLVLASWWPSAPLYLTHPNPGTSASSAATVGNTLQHENRFSDTCTLRPKFLENLRDVQATSLSGGAQKGCLATRTFSPPWPISLLCRWRHRAARAKPGRGWRGLTWVASNRIRLIPPSTGEVAF